MGEGATPPREDWNRPGKLADFLPRYENWKFDWLDVPAVIRAAHAIYEFPMVDRDPLPRWSHGRVTLLGDAAHPMYPIGSNGASQAILDGEAITQELAEGGDPEAAPCSATRSAACRPPPRIVESNRRRASTSCSTSSSSARRRASPTWRPCCRPRSWRRIVADYKKLAAQDRETLVEMARRCTIKNRPLAGPAVAAV